MIKVFKIGAFGASVRDTDTSKSRTERVFLRYFPATVQLHNLSGDFIRKLFKRSTDAEYRLDCNEKNWKVLDFVFR